MSNTHNNLDALSWLVGQWRGEALGGVVEEHWQAPSGGSMLGTFKLVVDGQVKFYELMTLVEVDDSLLLGIKHFNPDLSGWEAQDACIESRSQKLEAHQALFEGFTFQRIDENHLRIEAETKTPGKPLVFNYDRY